METEENKKNIEDEIKEGGPNKSEKSKNLVSITKEKLVEALDADGDGTVNIDDIIVLSLRVPGIRISREKFLRKELMKNYPEEVIDKAVKESPSKANIDLEEINKIADNVIKYERNCVSGISAALGTPGGVAMVATIPVDIIQYYGYMLRAAQKLMYLYGFPEINTEESEQQTFDSETMNILIICLGVMYGVAGANTALRAIAKGLANGISKKIMSTALTKGTIYPMIKSISKWFGVNVTKKMLAGAVQKSLPLVGGVIGGGITFLTFKPCCDKLKESLQDTLLSNPNHTEEKDEDIIFDKENYEQE